jgi:hypothetical protein
MVDLYSAKTDEVLGVLVYLAPLMSLIQARTLSLALLRLDGRSRSHSDFLIFGLTLVSSLVVVLTALSKASFAYILEVLSLARSEFGAMGWVSTFVWWLHVIAPFAVGLMLFIGRRRYTMVYGRVTDCL